MTIETIADFYSQTEIGRELINRGTERGAAGIYSVLLRQRFGSQAGIPGLAEQLARTQSTEAAVALIVSVESLEELVARAPAPPR